MKIIALNLDLAATIGVHESIVLQCLHEDIKAGVECAGRQWVVRTYAEWHTRIPCFAPDTIRKIANRLLKQRIITTRLVRQGAVYQLWMTIEYHRLNALGIPLNGAEHE